MPAAQPSRQRILVVDDDDSIRRLLAVFLRRRGYDVDEAENGRQALARLVAVQPQLIVTDLSMPELDGLGLIRRVRTDLPPPPVPILILSSHAELHGEEVLLAGADALLVKPVDLTRLEAIVGELLPARGGAESEP